MPALYKRAILLGLIFSVGAFAIDMYIPGFAAIARELHAGPGSVQLSMTSYFMALSVGQVIYGPVSDAVGRKPPLFAGLVLFIAASAGAALATSLPALILARFFQGLGAAATAVVPLAVIRDEYTGPDAARLLSIAMLALSVSPILAPMFGGVLVQYASWRVIFLALIVVALAGAALAALMLPETLARAARVPARPLPILLTYGRLIRARRFILPIMVGGAAQVVLFVFISGAPFIFVTLLKLRPGAFGVVFALHAMALIGVSQANAALMRRFGVRWLLVLCCALLLLASLGLVLAVLLLPLALWTILPLTLLLFAALGPIGGPAFLLAMEPFGEVAGAAAAIGAALEFGCSSGATALASLAADGTPRPFALFIAAGAAGAFCASLVLMGTGRGERKDLLFLKKKKQKDF